MTQHIFSGAGAPSTAPGSIGAHYIDTSNGDHYLSKGTASAADWVKQGGGNAGGSAAVGDIVHGAKPGVDWLPADGRPVAKATYPALYALLGDRPGRLRRNGATFADHTASIERLFSFGTYVFATLSGSSGLLRSADGGDTWTFINPLATTTNGYCVGPDRIIVVGNSGKIAYTTDGENWTLGTSGTTTTLYSAGYSPTLGMYVAVGASGNLRTSVDGGSTWTTRTSGFSTTTIRAVAWSTIAGCFVAVGASGKISSSTDGITWTARTSGHTDEMLVIAVQSDGSFVATRSTGSWATISADGITWTFNSTWSSYATWTWAADDGTIYRCDSSTGLLKTTDAGATWVPVTGAPEPTVKHFIDLPGVTFLVTAAKNAIRRSVDAWVSWQMVTNIMGTGTLQVTYGSGKHVAVSANGVHVSTDAGLTWTHVFPVGWTAGVCVGFSGGKFVAGMSSGKVAVSDDALTWSIYSTPASTDITSVTYSAGVLVGLEGNNVHTSVDGGTTWTTAAVGGGGSGKLASGNGVFLVVNSNSTYWSSVDGVTWTIGVAPYSGVTHVLFDGEKFLANSDTECINISYDGYSWMSAPIGVSADVAISFSGKTYVAISSGSYAKMFESDDGVNWSIFSQRDANPTAWTNGISGIAVGASGAIVPSSSGSYLRFTPDFDASTHFLLPIRGPGAWVKVA